MHIIVCGSHKRGLTFAEQGWLRRQLSHLGVTVVIHGDAEGIDRAAGAIAQKAGCTVQAYPAPWSVHGRAAGPIRNTEMLHVLQRAAWSDQVAVIAFPGGPGTANMITQATKVGIPVLLSPRNEPKEELFMPISERTELLTLCAQLHDVGIWLSLNDANALIMGPTALVKDHPDLLAAVRERKLDLVRLLEDCLVHDLYGTQTDDPRFTREECPECHQPCFIVTPPRRLGVHRLPGGAQVCPGSDRAQQGTAATIMDAFIADRCVTRTQGILTWYSIRGALEAWCCERAFLLPPRPFLIAWLDQHYTRHGEDDKPIWQGLGLTLPEWGLEDTPTKEPSPAPTKAPRPKLVLTA